MRGTGDANIEMSSREMLTVEVPDRNRAVQGAALDAWICHGPAKAAMFGHLLGRQRYLALLVAQGNVFADGTDLEELTVLD